MHFIHGKDKTAAVSYSSSLFSVHCI